MRRFFAGAIEALEQGVGLVLFAGLLVASGIYCVATLPRVAKR